MTITNLITAKAIINWCLKTPSNDDRPYAVTPTFWVLGSGFCSPSSDSCHHNRQSPVVISISTARRILGVGYSNDDLNDHSSGFWKDGWKLKRKAGSGRRADLWIAPKANRYCCFDRWTIDLSSLPASQAQRLGSSHSHRRLLLPVACPDGLLGYTGSY